MRRIVLWALSTVTVLVLLFGYDTSTSATLASGGPAAVRSGAEPGGSSDGSGSGETVTGPVVSTQWGPVQVQLTMDAGAIAGVDVLQYPDGNPRDSEINSYALPVLVQETIDAQSADIDMVSGATVTSDGYIRSLQGALDRLGA